MKPRREEPTIHLTLGSHYRIRSLASREAVLETDGTFRGVVSVGSIDGLAIELGDGPSKGKIRVIPTHMVLSIDIVEAVTREEETVEDAQMHYT